MSTLSNNYRGLSFASTFLSHSSADAALAEAVAQRLGRRGVLAWLDKNELLEMGSLDVALREAVRQQATFTIFLSEASLASSWCKDELRWALEARESYEHLLPVYLGDPLKLVKSHDLLRNRFLHPDGDRVNQLGHVCQQNPTDSDADAIAGKIAATVYQRSIPKPWSEVVIVLDQRGNGQRRGLPELPANFENLNAPVLTFRPNLGPRQQRELIAGRDWEDVVQTMMKSLSSALRTVRGETRKIRVLGNAQTGLVWAVGRHFNRTTAAELYAYDRDGNPFTNKGQVRHTPLPEGNPDAAKPVEGSPSIKPGTDQLEIALGVGSEGRYGSAVQQAAPDLPLFWIESGFISDSEQAMKLVADIVASVERLRRDYGVRELVLFWTTANPAALLAAANLASHVIPAIKFMEWDHARAEYVHLPMPGGV